MYTEPLDPDAMVKISTAIVRFQQNNIESGNQSHTHNNKISSRQKPKLEHIKRQDAQKSDYNTFL